MDHKWQKQKAIVEQDRLIELNLGVERTGSIAKRFLIEKHGAKCFNCNWSETNVHTGKVPIELDHKDGNCSNNRLDNLRLLCPNCHSLTSTYKGGNKGKNKSSERYNNWKKRFQK
jgi:Zn finger protein HypA/HybF involved in hydrogenase expression